MKIYVAGKFSEYKRVRAVIDALINDGHEITYDWTRTSEFDENGEPKVAPGTGGQELPYMVQRGHALNDKNGVRDCDCIVVLADASLCGAHMEFGMALAWDKWAIVVAPERWSIFYTAPKTLVLRSLNQLDEAVYKVEDHIAYGSTITATLHTATYSKL